jgi:hypothetical protein
MEGRYTFIAIHLKRGIWQILLEGSLACDRSHGRYKYTCMDAWPAWARKQHVRIYLPTISLYVHTCYGGGAVHQVRESCTLIDRWIGPCLEFVRIDWSAHALNFNSLWFLLMFPWESPDHPAFSHPLFQRPPRPEGSGGWRPVSCKYQ